MPFLEVSNLTSGYGKLVIVQDVSFGLDDSRILDVIGPNGCGKSTLLKSIMGYAAIFNGNIIYQGKDITNRATDRLIKMGIGYVPQINNVFLNLSVEENLKLGLSFASEKKRHVKNRRRNTEFFPCSEREETQEGVYLEWRREANAGNSFCSFIRA
jgi:ABC-type branched-subunit amino acid transport system ATPase component